MNNEAYKVLENIYKKSPAELNPYDRSFLRARRDYLTETMKQKYAEVLDEKITVKVDELKTSYHDLKKEAKALGLAHTQISRKELEAYIKSHK